MSNVRLVEITYLAQGTATKKWSMNSSAKLSTSHCRDAMAHTEETTSIANSSLTHYISHLNPSLKAPS